MDNIQSQNIKAFFVFKEIEGEEDFVIFELNQLLKTNDCLGNFFKA